MRNENTFSSCLCFVWLFWQDVSKTCWQISMACGGTAGLRLTNCLLHLYSAAWFRCTFKCFNKISLESYKAVKEHISPLKLLFLIFSSTANTKEHFLEQLLPCGGFNYTYTRMLSWFSSVFHNKSPPLNHWIYAWKVLSFFTATSLILPQSWRTLSVPLELYKLTGMCKFSF